MQRHEVEFVPVNTTAMESYMSNQNGDLEASNGMSEDRWKSTNEPYDINQTAQPKQQFHLLPGARIEPRPYEHKYFFRRPQLLQYFENGEFVDSRGHRLASSTVNELSLPKGATTRKEDGSGNDVHEHLVERDSDKSTAQRNWLNLFIDLLWAGIVSNISENFTSSAFEPGNSWGLAFVEYTILFLAAFKLWNYLRLFLNNFFNKDYLQSVFITWILILALIFGNQSPHFLEPGGSSVVIWTYLIAKFSILIMETIYSIFIPKMRKQLLFKFIIVIPNSVLWIGALKVAWPSKAALMLPALLLEGLVSVLISLPAGDWFLRGAPKMALDPDNYIERLQGFFIVILGEGVFTLIQGSSWGLGISQHVGAGVMALLIFYALFQLFFTGDRTKIFIHAVFRNRYTAVVFESVHVTLYSSLLLLDSSIRYYIESTFEATTNEPDETEIEDHASRLHLARWTVAAALTMTIACLTAIALLNRSLDGPRTLWVNNRYVRMAPRAIAALVVLLLPLKSNMSTNLFLGVSTTLLMAVLFWEYMASLEKEWRWVEPKEAID